MTTAQDLGVGTTVPRVGDTLPTQDGGSVRLGVHFGLGGQGGVYAVDGDPNRCIKIYYVSPGVKADGLRRRFEKLKAKAASLDTQTLVLPTAVLAEPYVGYVMHRVRDAVPLSSLAVVPRSTPVDQWYQRTGGLRRRLLLAHALVHAFRALHLKGLAYNDLSWENVLVPEAGRATVHLIDCDNLSVDGVPSTGIQGTPWFIAPEVIGGSHQPDTISDQHALAVLLYHLLVLTHPLLGDTVRRGSPEQEQAALAGRWPFTEAAYERLPWVDHASDTRNRTQTGLPRGWVLSPGMQALFDQAFTDGLNGPTRTERPNEKRWLMSIGQATDATVVCPSCTHSYYINQRQCPWCDTARPPHWVLLCGHPGGRRPVVVQSKRRLYSRHLQARADVHAAEPLLMLQASQTTLEVEAFAPIKITRPGADVRSFDVGASLTLKPGDGFELARPDGHSVFVEVKRG